MKNLLHNRKEIVIIFFAFSLLYFVTRLINILQMPVFVDEGNYIIWAKQALVQKQYFISLTDGKPPLSLWGEMVFISLTPHNPLLGLRLFAVFSGYVATIGFFLLSHKLFGRKPAYISTFFYILTPFFVLYDRVGMVDSLVNVFGIFILYLSILLVEQRKWGVMIVFGTICGLGLLTKSNVWLFIYSAAFAPLLLLKKGKNKEDTIKQSVHYWILYGVSILIAQLIYRIQLFAPYPDPLSLVSGKTGNFFYPLETILKNPISMFFNIVPERSLMLFHMTGWITGIYAVFGFITLLKKETKLAVYLLIWFSSTLLVATFLLEHFFVRYILFCASPLVLIAGYWIASIRNSKYKILAGTVLLGSFFYFNYALWFNYTKMQFPYAERVQFVEGIASGYGIKEIAEFTKEKAKEKPVIIVNEGIFGVGAYNVESAFSLYEKEVTVTGTWPLSTGVLQNLQPYLKTHHIFVVLNYTEVSEVPKEWPIKLVKEYKKPYSQPYYKLYSLTQ